MADTFNNRVQKFSNEGEFLASWGGPDSFFPVLEFVFDVAVDDNGDILIPDGTTNIVWRLGMDGRLLGMWNMRQPDGQVATPTGIALDDHGLIYITDALNHRVKKFTREGVFIESWGGRWSEDGQFLRPRGITFDSRGCTWP